MIIESDLDSAKNFIKPYNHILGGCFKHHSLKYAYVPIPKNASLWIGHWLNSKKFGNTPNVLDNYNFLDQGTSDLTFIVALRDPLKRWVSGIVQFFSMRFPDIRLDDPKIIDKIFSVIKFDEHTEYQISFLNKLNTDNCVFFYIDSGFKTRFLQYAKKTFGYSYDYEISSHSHSLISDRIIKQNQLYELLDANPSYVTLIKNFYKSDYYLISQVQFYQ
jgi:hypothetical protein